MTNYEEQKFAIPELKGISKKSIEEHLKLYAGYVKNTNMILTKTAELAATPADREKNAYVIGELQRRFSFEFDGMRNHEYYFRSLEGGGAGGMSGSGTGGVSGANSVAGNSGKMSADASSLKKAIAAEFGDFDGWLSAFKTTASTIRSIGWLILYYDPQVKRLVQGWVGEQHNGHLNGLHYIVGIDMWEHSYVFDYQPSGKKQYVEDFFSNVNWQVIEVNFAKATGATMAA